MGHRHDYAVMRKLFKNPQGIDPPIPCDRCGKPAIGCDDTYHWSELQKSVKWCSPEHQPAEHPTMIVPHPEY